MGISQAFPTVSSGRTQVSHGARRLGLQRRLLGVLLFILALVVSATITAVELPALIDGYTLSD